jgi:hypothetical protein
MNASMPRWIVASIAKVLMEAADDMTVPAIVESINDRTKAFEAAPNRAEIRITGPYTSESSKGYYRALVDVNVLLMTQVASQTNAYASITLAGGFQEVMSDPIAVYNYGSEDGDYVAGDENTLIQLGCLTVRQKRPVSIRNFGQVDPAAKLDQQEISASYEMEWQE